MLFLADMLNSRGHEISIDSRFVPDTFFRQERYDAAPYLADPEDIVADRLVIVGANEISDEVQLLLRSMPISSDAKVWAFGRFTTRQAQINSTNRIAYAVGFEPDVIDLSLTQKNPLIEDDLCLPVTFKTDAKPRRMDRATQIMAYVPAETLEEPETLPELVNLSYQKDVSLHILTSGQGKNLIQQSRFDGLSVFGINELLPRTMVHYADAFVVYGTNVPGARMANLALHAMAAGNPVIDCTTNAAFAATGAPVLEGPQDLRALATYLQASVLDSRADIGARIQQSDWLTQFDVVWLEQVLGIAPTPPPDTADTNTTVFYPTNGNGLGHAQRCSVIAEAMDDKKHVQFAAFPSCVDLLRNRGFAVVPMVQRTEMHAEEYANDLVNYLRLRGMLKTGDTFVFDGGYVFDSIYRAISELQLPAVWIRRGLWQPGQVKPSALERERVFSKVVVPQEAFDELNSRYTTGDNVQTVGPVVRPATPDDPSLRDKLSKLFKRPAKTLVVTMLGGGVASERTAQTQVMCNLMEQRKNCIHLVVAWPNAIVSSGLYGWKNTHVIKTQNTGALCRAADLVVSAVGYNSFHEIMYSGIPSIMIPQFAPYLDDQERRARAAADRGLTSLVLETELVRLKQEVTAFLDEGKAEDIRAAFAETELPDRGNHAAASIIESEGRT